MNIKELMVGDWICDKSRGYPIYIKIKDTCQLSYLSENENRYNPILITKEILINNDFIKIEDCEIYHTKFINHNDEVDISYNIINKSLLINIPKKISIDIKGNFNYVHELQELLRILKINKEIKL